MNARTTRPFTRLLTSTLAASALLASLTACSVRGSGTPATETREVEAFESIDIGGAYKLTVHVDPQNPEHKLEIRGDDNIVPLVRTVVEGDNLEVDFDVNKMVRPKLELELEAWVPKLSAIDVSGAAEIEITGLHGSSFEVDLSGATDTTLSGAVDHFEVDISGAGELKARELKAKEVDLDLSGSGEAEVYASDRLEVEVSGSGEVRYWGEPGEVGQEVSGSGSVEPGT